MNIGILGSGLIVPDFLAAASKIKEYKFYGICATERSKDRMENFSKEYGIKHIYLNYDEMLDNEEIDVIYVAVSNSLHYSFTKKALLKNKNVILEKPFTSNYEEAKELAELAEERGLYLFEAITNQYYPNYLKIKELLPELGDVKIVQLNYSQYSRRYDEFKKGNVLPVFDPKKSGGALMDLNVYNIHFVLGLFGEPQSINYFANIERDIDTSGILVLNYPTFKCVAVGAKDCKAPTSVNIQGDKGYIHSDYPSSVLANFTYGSNLGEEKEFNLNVNEERLYYELVAFKDMILNKDFEKNLKQLKHSLNVMKILDEARRQVGIEIQSSK